jgi:hypothetical protein
MIMPLLVDPVDRNDAVISIAVSRRLQRSLVRATCGHFKILQAARERS